jgi:hypothetical protein
MFAVITFKTGDGNFVVTGVFTILAGEKRAGELMVGERPGRFIRS